MTKSMTKKMPPIPHIYGDDFPKAYIKEYARRYKVLWAVKEGLPVSATLNLRNYINYLGLLKQDSKGRLSITQKAIDIYFTPHDFGSGPDDEECPPSSKDGWPF